MVLDGLEENEDFWKMDLSDDEAPIREPTPNNARSGVQLCQTSPCAAFNADDATRDGQGATASLGGLNADKQAGKEGCLSRPEKLPNGKYRY